MTTKPKNRLIAMLLASALGVSLAIPLVAQESRYGSDMPSATKSERGKAAETTAARDMRASKVIGMKVHNPQGESLGKIDDLIVDVNNERVAYAVLSFGGALGMGSKLFAYPLALFQPAAGRSDELVLNVDKDKLKSAPGFERKNWPDWNESSYLSSVDRYFGPTVTPKAMPNQRLARASELIGKNVDDRSGRHAGELKDLVVNLGTAKVHYAVLDFDKAWSVDDKLLPLSLKTFTFPENRRKDLLLNVAKNELDMSYGFDAKKWPDVSDPTYQRDIDKYLERTASIPRPAGEPGQAGPMRE